jgi:hypothetical protein
MKNAVFILLMGIWVSACTLPASVVREYSYLPMALSKKEFRKVVEEKNSDIKPENGYVKLYDLVALDRTIRRNLFLEESLFADSYAQPKDSALLRTNLIRLATMKNRNWVWPSVYPEMYKTKINPNYWTAWLDRGVQQAYRDSIDMATNPILKASRYKLNPKYYSVYKYAMQIKKVNLKKASKD